MRRVRLAFMSGGLQPLLLDLYPNAAAAYSVRKLRTAYTGNAIRVRRASDNAEQNIGFDALGNLDTSALTTFCTGTNGFVTIWYDQSGNGKNSVQNTAIQQPQIVLNGSVLTFNGKPRAQFDGSNDKLVFNQIAGVTGMTLISVHKYNFISNNGNPYEGSDTILAYSGGFIEDASIGGRQNKAQIYFENGSSNFTAGATIATGTQYLQFGYVSTAGSGISTNGSLTTGVAGLNTSIVRAIAQDGSSSFFNGDIQEAIIYSTSQSLNRGGIENDIKTYYGIP